MQYRPIDQLSNQFITSANRERIDNSVAIRTDLGNVINVPLNDEVKIEDLDVVQEVDIQFIVKIGNIFYTSQRVKDNLEEAREQNNPFYDTTFLTIVEVNVDRINDLMTNLESAQRDLGVTLDDVSSQPDAPTNREFHVDLIKQIFWSVTPVPLDGSVPSHYSEIGEWTIRRLPNQTFNPENSVRLLTEEELERIASESQPVDDTDRDTNGDTNGNNGDVGSNGAGSGGTGGQTNDLDGIEEDDSIGGPTLNVQ